MRAHHRPGMPSAALGVAVSRLDVVVAEDREQLGA